MDGREARGPLRPDRAGLGCPLFAGDAGLDHPATSCSDAGTRNPVWASPCACATAAWHITHTPPAASSATRATPWAASAAWRCRGASRRRALAGLLGIPERSLQLPVDYQMPRPVISTRHRERVLRAAAESG